MRLLLVEDEKNLSDALIEILKDYKYSVDAAYDGENGLDLAETEIYDLIVLDRMLPNKEGIQVLKELRAKGVNTPVLILTAKDTVENKVEGLDAGADDYLVKPFATKEFLARVRALSRRPPDHIQTNNLQVGFLVLDILNCEATSRRETIRLTYKESQLLEFFIRNKGQVITKGQIWDKVWGLDTEVESNNIEAFIHLLRKKMIPENCGFHIETIRGIGYCLKEKSHV
jgi:DNA-binding response OmpR family regulator